MSGFCVLFGGQAVQERGMCRELWRHPVARQIFERLAPILGDDLEYIGTEMPDHELMLTFHAQRAIHAHHLGHWFAFESHHPGLQLGGAIGHSMGIVAALVAAGAMTVEDSGHFILARAKAFAAICAAPPEHGLAAVSTESFDDLIDELPAFAGVTVALRNTVGKGILGGPTESLNAFQCRAEQQGWPLRLSRLNVQGAYHTEIFRSCRDPLRAVLSNLRVSCPKVSVFMGTSGRQESDPERIKDLLADQVCTTESHLQAVRAAYQAGLRNFIEVAHHPQPIQWISEQLADDSAGRPADVVTRAVTTEALDEPIVLT